MHGHVMLYINCYRYMVILYDTSPTIDVWSYHMILHLPSIHGHVMWYITYHTCMSTCRIAQRLPSMHGHVLGCMVMLFDVSPIIDMSTCHIAHQLRSCHVIHHLPLIHGYVIWNITYHRCMVMSLNTSPTSLTFVYICIMVLYINHSPFHSWPHCGIIFLTS